MVKADQILDTTKVAAENIRGAAGNVDGITAKIDQGTGTVGALINDKALYQKATASVTALGEDAEALKQNFFLRGFFKERGYENASDLKANEIKQMPQNSPQKIFTYDAKQLFDKSDSAKLKNQKLLKEAGQYLQMQTAALAVVVSSTDPKGGARKNHELSEARAYVVRQYLVDNLSLDELTKNQFSIDSVKNAVGSLSFILETINPGTALAVRSEKC
jgi:outer membrane protein OmpA-like peptidoglycan-associated protein